MDAASTFLAWTNIALGTVFALVAALLTVVVLKANQAQRKHDEAQELAEMRSDAEKVHADRKFARRMDEVDAQYERLLKVHEEQTWLLRRIAAQGEAKGVTE